MSPELAAKIARSTLGHVGREYPHALAHAMEGPEEVRPALLHPIFHGSFDWHSCVHAWWQLLRLSRQFPELSPEIHAQADVAFTEAKVAGELGYLQRQPLFERPYGWAWLLALHGEASLHDAPWASNLEPVARLIAGRFAEYMPRLTYPVRAGTHSNSAFALVLAHQWAVTYDSDLAQLIHGWAREKFGGDVAAAHQEPSGEDFLSPTLTEALLMSRVMPADAFERWFDVFLPTLSSNLLKPVKVPDRSDGRIGHLDGLNLSRAWCWRGLAQRLPHLRDVADIAADELLAAAIPHLADGYMGEHWLATFALLALTSDSDA